MSVSGETADGVPAGVAVGVAAEIAALVAVALPDIAARIPAVPAEALGRLGDRRRGTTTSTRSLPGPTPGPLPPRVMASVEPPTPALPPAPVPMVSVLPPSLPQVDAGAPLGAGVAERLLGALELAVADLRVPVPDPVADRVGAAVVGERAGPGVATAVAGVTDGAGALSVPMQMLGQLVPGAAGFTLDLVRALLDTHAVGSLTGSVETGAGETGAGETGAGENRVTGTGAAAVAAEHGRMHLAVATVASTVVLRAADRWTGTALFDQTTPETVVGLALQTATGTLTERPMPTGWLDARRAERRAQYLLPRMSSAQVRAEDGRVALTETDDAEPRPPVVALPDNGLVSVVGAGIVLHTSGRPVPVDVRVEVLEADPGPPRRVRREDVVDVSYTARQGGAVLVGAPNTVWPPDEERTFPWPGPVRVRVYARDRDSGGPERFELHVWEAPLAPEVVHHRRAPRPDPEEAYLWLRASALQMAATVTFVAGGDADHVLRAFGADPARPYSRSRAPDYPMNDQVAVVATRGGVVAVEDNGWSGSTAEVLGPLSAGTLVASMYWSVNADTRLSFARDGVVLDGFEPGLEPVTSTDPAVVAALDGLPLDDPDRPRDALALVAAERFAGVGFTADDLARLEAEDQAYRSAPPG